MAVSTSATTSSTDADSPVSRGTPVRYGALLGAHQPGGPACVEAGRDRESLLQRTLGAALRTGGDFAEVFVEDRRSSSAHLDDGRVEELTSGRDRGAGIRVVDGETTGYAHTADLSEAGLRAAAEAASAAARRRDGGINVVDLTRRPTRRPNDVAVLPETVAKAAKVELLKRADEAARGMGSSIVQVSAGYGDSRRRILVANSEGLLAEDDQVKTALRVNVVASGDTGMQTGYESLGHTIGFELFDRYDVEELARRAARPRPHQAERPPGAVGHDARRHQVRRRRRAVPRGLRARPRGRPGGQERLGVRGAHRRARGQPPGHAGRRRHHGRGVGRHRHRRRGPRLAAQRADPGRRAHRLHVGLAAGPQGGPRARRATAAGRATTTCPWCG